MPWFVITVNTLAFALCFAAWVIFGPSARLIAKDLHLPAEAIPLIKTIPILVGSLTRIPLGMLTDRFGARVMMPMVMMAAGSGLFGLQAAHNMTMVVAGALVLGFAGSSFAVGVASISSWTPPARRGAALGFFGAGNAGTAITTLCLPLLIVNMGWRNAYCVYGGVLLAAAVTYAAIGRNSPREGLAPSLAQLLAPLGRLNTWRFGIYYVACFGVFVALTLTLGDIYISAYRVSAVRAGLLSTVFTFTASVARIPGGLLADRWGARRVSLLSSAVALVSLTPICFGPAIAMTVSLGFIAAIALGVGMAAVYRYIPDYFPAAVGAVGGMVGALGGLGGFFLPQLSALTGSWTGSLYLAMLPLIASILVSIVMQWFMGRSFTTPELSSPGARTFPLPAP